VRGIGELGMSKIDDLVEYLIDEDKIFANDFLVNHPTEVFNDDYNPIEKFKDV
jgi:hypothetical protein